MSGMLHMLTVLTIDKAHANTLNRWVREEGREREIVSERGEECIQRKALTHILEKESIVNVLKE